MPSLLTFIKNCCLLMIFPDFERSEKVAFPTLRHFMPLSILFQDIVGKAVCIALLSCLIMEFFVVIYE